MPKTKLQREFLAALRREKMALREEKETLLKTKEEEKKAMTVVELDPSLLEELEAPSKISPILVMDYVQMADEHCERLLLEDGSKVPVDFFSAQMGFVVRPRPPWTEELCQKWGELCPEAQPVPTVERMQFLYDAFGQAWLLAAAGIYHTARVRQHMETYNATTTWIEHNRVTTCKEQSTSLLREWEERNAQDWAWAVGDAFREDSVDKMLDAFTEHDLLLDQVFRVEQATQASARQIDFKNSQQVEFTFHEIAIMYNATACLKYLNSAKPVNLAPLEEMVPPVMRAIFTRNLVALEEFLIFEGRSVRERGNYDATTPCTTRGQGAATMFPGMGVCATIVQALMTSPDNDDDELCLLETLKLYMAFHVREFAPKSFGGPSDLVARLAWMILEKAAVCNAPHVFGWICFYTTGLHRADTKTHRSMAERMEHVCVELDAVSKEHHDYMEDINKVMQESQDRMSWQRLLCTVVENRQFENTELLARVINDEENPKAAYKAMVAACDSFEVVRKARAATGLATEGRRTAAVIAASRDADDKYGDYVKSYSEILRLHAERWEKWQEEEARELCDDLCSELQAEEKDLAERRLESADDRAVGLAEFIATHGSLPDTYEDRAAWLLELAEESVPRLKKMKEKIKKKMASQKKASDRICEELLDEAQKADRCIENAAEAYRTCLRYAEADAGRGDYE